MSENLAGKTLFRMFERQREAELAYCGAVESALALNPGVELRVCKRTVVGASLKQDLKWKSWLAR